MGNRPRIKKKALPIEGVYEKNCATDNAKYITTYKDFEIELWLDKHYQNRIDYGDNEGKREGIEFDIVKDLIVDSFKYIFHFYIKHRGLQFINFFNKAKPTNYRVVLKKYVDENPLNVVIEIHFLDYSKYEITIKTAMVIEDFKLSDGQYSISVDENNVRLNRFVNKVNTTIEIIDI